MLLRNSPFHGHVTRMSRLLMRKCQKSVSITLFRHSSVSICLKNNLMRAQEFFSINGFLKSGSFYYQFCLAIFKFTGHENAATDTPGQNLESTQLFSICGEGNNVASFVIGICVGTFGINNIFDVSSSQPRPSFLCSQMHPESRAQRCTLGSRSIASLKRRAQD